MHKINNLTYSHSACSFLAVPLVTDFIWMEIVSGFDPYSVQSMPLIGAFCVVFMAFECIKFVA